MWPKTHGKAEVLDQLSRLLSAAVARPQAGASALIVEGAEGVGKTHLLEAAAALAERSGAHVIGPVDGRELTRCPSCWGGATTDAPEPLGGRPVPALAAGEVLLVTLDDVHLADPDRLHLEARWLSRRVDAPIVWMCTVRSPGSSATLPVDDIVYGTLAELTEAEVEQLVTELLGAPPAASLSELVAEAGGNPRLITELIVGLREEGALHPVDGRMQALGDVMPKRVCRAVRQRLDALSPRCRRMLQIGATVDRQLSPSALAEMLAEPVAGVLPLLEEARESGMVISNGSALRFRSKLLWRAIRASVPGYMHAALRNEAQRADGARRDDSPWDVLRDKEREIARLAGEGLTNQQIARRVYLSPHTVNYHLRGIFRKLDVTSRTELARLLADTVPPRQDLGRGA